VTFFKLKVVELHPMILIIIYDIRLYSSYLKLNWLLWLIWNIHVLTLQ